MTLVVERATNTTLLALPAVALAWLVALPLGLWMSMRRDAPLDRVVMLASTVLAATPDVVLAFLVLWAALRTGTFGTLATAADVVGTPWTHPLALWSAIRLPLVVVVLIQLPLLVRQVRLTAWRVVDQPFVRHVRARGVPDRRIAWAHVARAAAPALLTLLGGSLAGAMSGALVAEVVFSWPGLGALLFGAAQARDDALLAGTVVTLGAVLVTTGLIADSAAWLADPRRREHT